MPATLKLEIVTPEALVFAGQVEMVTLPGLSGEMGIYPLHVPLVTQIVAGEVTVRSADGLHAFAVGDGFAKVSGDEVSVFTDMAVEASSIDEAAVEEARRRAEARLREKLNDEEAATVNAVLAHSLTQLQVKRRRHG